MRVLIDTNIFVSAVLTRQRGKTSLVEWLVFVALIAHRRFELVTSNQLLREVGDVLVRRGVAERAADSFV
ncbi:MAG: hypothetical protein QOJ39_1315, partial [Candidatus Eremiobacteraeota bacterium]|nr:hypothetical protein [Candidatus Eremiobacteraeota bacterium]